MLERTVLPHTVKEGSRKSLELRKVTQVVPNTYLRQTGGKKCIIMIQLFDNKCEIVLPTLTGLLLVLEPK